MQSRSYGIEDSQECQLSSLSPRYKSKMPSRLPISPTATSFTVPPGLTPTALLDSPVLFNALSADPSPTTGSLSNAHRKLPAGAESMDDTLNPEDSFCPLTALHQELLTNSTGRFGVLYHPALQHADGLSQLVLPRLPLDALIPTFESTCDQTSDFLHSGLDCPEPTDPVTKPSETVLTSRVSDLAPQYISGRTADGFKWKKYGQKQLKGTEFLRSYYKCTHPYCPVKKQVECSLQGEVTQILYKGDHNHPKLKGPHRNDASILGRSEVGTHSLTLESSGEVSSAVDWTDCDRFSTDWSPSSLLLSHGGLASTPDHSLGSPSIKEGEANKAEDDHEGEQDSKRRRIAKEILTSASIMTIRESRVLVQTTSEVDILDDGYRWRKYGQKVVKGNRFPRNYYKCTNIGCIVRKQVERSSTDPTCVMTTYEGKHNHDVPVAWGGAREVGGGPSPITYYNSHLQIMTTS